MKLTLLDYEGKKKEFEIGELKDIQRITIEVISGDEIAAVLYKDYKITKFDSSGCRMIGFPDGEYDIYDETEGIDLINNEKWQSRKRSYDGIYECYDEEYEEVES